MLITLYLVPRALHPSAIRHARTAAIRGGFLAGEDGRTERLCHEGTLSAAPSATAAFRRFDIVTAEGEGCSTAGWEEMSAGDSERKTDGISVDEEFFFPPCFLIDP